MAIRIHGVQDEIFAAHPCVEDFRHVRPNTLQSLGLGLCEMFLATFVVDPVELVDDIVPDFFEDAFPFLGLLHVPFKMAGVIMNEQVWVYFLHLHGFRDQVGFLRSGLVDGMLHSSDHMPRKRINDELPTSSPILKGEPLLVFVGTGAGPLIMLVVFLLGPAPQSNSPFILQVLVEFAMDSKMAVEGQRCDFLGRWKEKRFR